MTRYGLGVFILRVVIPIMISISLVMRPSIMCLIYLGMLLYLPFINLIDERNLETGTFKYVMTFLPYQTMATQLGFYLYTLSTDEILMEENSDLRRLLKNIGLSPLLNLSMGYSVCWFGPEVVMIAVSILYTWSVRMMASKEGLSTKEDAEQVWQEKFKYLKISASTGKFITIVFLLWSAMWHHCIFGVCYFLIFLFFMSVWALNKSLVYTLSIVLFFCMPIAMMHTIGQYIFQIEQIQYKLSDQKTQLRKVGIDQLLEPKPDYGPDYTHYEYHGKDIVRLLYPIIVYVLYYFMVNEAMMLNSLNKFLTEERRRSVVRRRTSVYTKVLEVATRRVETTKKSTGNLQSLVGESTKRKFWRHTRNVSKNVVALIVKYSYVGAICAYMMWSVTFLTWSSLMFLTLSIILWMVPNQRKATVYSCFGVIMFSYFNMTYLYLVGVGDGSLFQIGGAVRTGIFQFYEISRFVTLEVCIKVMFTVMFWVTIRKYMQDRAYSELDAMFAEEAGISGTDISERKENILEKICLYFLVRYWIVAIALFIISSCVFYTVIRIFRIINMFEYLIFMLILQLSFRLWRRLLSTFWLVMILITLLNMSIICIYEIAGGRVWFEQTFGIPKGFDDDFGAKIYSSRAYVTRLFYPIVFMTMILIQIRFFHKRFMNITDGNNKTLAAEIEADKELFGNFFRHFVDLTGMVFLFLEMHIIKAVTLLMFLMCILDASAFHFLILMPLCLSMIVPSQSARLAVMYWAAILVSFSTLASLIYSLRYFDESNYDITCNMTKHPDINQTTKNLAHWIGFKKHTDDTGLMIVSYIAWQTAFVLASCLRNVVIAVQRITRKQQGLPTNPPKVMFPEVTYREADLNLKNYIKYIMNYGFYRIGHEICMTMIVILIVLRIDGYAIMYSVWLCLLLILSRSILRWTWILFVTFVALSIIWQYIMAIGPPPNLCIEYDWETRTYYWTVAQDFWFLVDNYHSPPIKKLVPEAVLLMVASQQMICFWTEIKNSRHKTDYDGGTNSSIVSRFEEPGFVNPVGDFTTYTTSYLDIAKKIFINISYWGCIWLVFLGSVNRVNIFSIIYLCYVFIYLWHGLNIYYKPLPLILKYWNHLIVQNVLIICMKTGLQVIGCFYMPDIPMQYCGLIKLFGIGCVRNFEDTDYFEKLNEGKTICRASKSEMSGVEWDAAIFYFLMIQRRVFCSYNFFHIINDTKAQHVLSARGAYFLGELFEKRIEKIKAEERRVRQSVEAKLTKLLNNQKRIQGAYYKNRIVTHKMAIRSGDYYMFDDNETDVEEESTFKQKEEKQAKRRDQRHNLVSLFGDMFDSNMRTAVRKYWDTNEDKRNVRQIDDEPYGITARIVYFFKFCFAAINVLVVSATEFFEKYTKTYDRVRAELYKEKRQLKEQTDYDVGVRVEGWWLPRGSFEGLMKNSKLPRPKRPPKEMSTTDLPDSLKLLKALWIIIVARSDLLCYCCIVMNQVMQCQLITIPLCSMVYMWGMLSNPRPSKTFWIIMIGYVELVILLKCIFQFEMMPGNNLPNEKTKHNPMEEVNPFFPSKFMGLRAMEQYYIWEMFILMAIIIHRFYLTNIGLWTTVTTSFKADTVDGAYTMNNGALARTDLGPSTSTASSNEYLIRSTKTSTLDNILLSIKTILFQYAISFRQFHQRLLLHVYQEAHDYYTVMFFFDFLAFVTVSTTFPVFSEYEPKDTVWTYVSTSVVPVRYVMVVFVHFICILVDRAIYLKKSMVLKLVYHLIQVVFVHMWLFILIPHFISGRMAIEQPAITTYYIFRCIYIQISAQQIRVGYPSRIWGLYCCKGFGLWNYINIRGYLLIPFLFELRSSFDWIFTESTMSVFDWFKMEDIYTSVFKVKCVRGIEEEYCTVPGVKKKVIYKYLYGISLLIVFMTIIWFPIMVYSWGRVAGQSNVPSSATLKFQIGDVKPIYENKAIIFKLKNIEYEYIKQVYNAYDISKQFLYEYDHSDVTAITFRTGGATWMIRQQEKEKMIKILHGAHPVPIVMSCEIILPAQEDQKELSSSVRKMLFPYSTNRLNSAKMMNGEKTEEPFKIRYLLPKFLKVEQRGKVSTVNVLMLPEPTDEAATRARNITFQSVIATEGNGRVWWDVREEVEDMNYAQFLDKMPYASKSDGSITVFTFTDKIVHSFFSMVTGGSIITFYSLFLFVIHGWSRQVISRRMGMTWLYEVPQADVLYALCKEVYICREANMWELEEVAAARVFFMIKSSETAGKLSRFHGNPYNPSINKPMPPITRRS